MQFVTLQLPIRAASSIRRVVSGCYRTRYVEVFGVEWQVFDVLRYQHYDFAKCVRVSTS